jgi:hypothetical protein
LFHPLSATLRSHAGDLTLKCDAFTIGGIGIATFGTIIVPIAMQRSIFVQTDKNVIVASAATIT